MFGVTRRFAVAAASKYEALRSFSVGGALSSNGGAARPEISVPNYKPNPNETIEVKKARLLYQSRKRGMLENDLLLSTFADKHLEGMDADLLNEYDSLINSQHSDWDIYYWVVGTKPTPPEFNNRVMALLKEHVKNKDKEARYRQPDLPSRLQT